MVLLDQTPPSGGQRNNSSSVNGLWARLLGFWLAGFCLFFASMHHLLNSMSQDMLLGTVGSVFVISEDRDCLPLLCVWSYRLGPINTHYLESFEVIFILPCLVDFDC